MESKLADMYTESVKENVPNTNEKRNVFGVLHTIGQQIERKLMGEQNKIKNKFDSIKDIYLSQVCVHVLFFTFLIE